MQYSESQKRGLDNKDEDSGKYGKRQNVEESTALLKLLVPHYVASQLIGKGGEAIKEMKRTYGGFVRISPGRKYYPGTDERVVVIIGSISELKAINAHIMEKTVYTIRSSPATLADPGRSNKVNIVLTDLAAGLLVGKGGGSIKAIQYESKARLHVAMPDEVTVPGERVISVFGTHEQREAACNLLIDKVSMDASNINNSRMDYELGIADSLPSTLEGSSPSPVPSKMSKANVTIEFQVGDVMVGGIMGKHGMYLKDMVKRTGATFKFSDKVPGVGRTLTISGNMSQSQSAYLLVAERVTQLEKEEIAREEKKKKEKK